MPTRAPQSFSERKSEERPTRRFCGDRDIGLRASRNGRSQMRSKSQTAWETAGRCAAQEANDPEEREHYTRLRNTWTTLAKRCEPFNFPAEILGNQK